MTDETPLLDSLVSLYYGLNINKNLSASRTFRSQLLCDFLSWTTYSGFTPVTKNSPVVEGMRAFPQETNMTWGNGSVPFPPPNPAGLYDPSTFMSFVKQVHDKAQDSGLRQTVIWLKDADALFKMPNSLWPGMMSRMLKDFSDKFITHKIKLIFSSSRSFTEVQGDAQMPRQISHLMHNLNWSLPNKAEIINLLNSVSTSIKNGKEKTRVIGTHKDVLSIDSYLSSEIKRSDKILANLSKITDAEKSVLADNLSGLSYRQILAICNNAVLLNGNLNLKLIRAKRAEILASTGILEIIESSSSMREIGGMNNLKKYLAYWSGMNTPEAKEAGVESLKGVFCVGPPGTGKSLFAKAVASELNSTLVKLDVTKVFNKYVGESEANMRSALQQLEVMSPVVVWIDEIEKVFRQDGGGTVNNGGTTQHVLGQLLTQMQEGFKNVTVIATSNDIEAVPPELLRRFDETFFIDIPNQSELNDILKILIEIKKIDKANIDTAEAVKHMTGFTGAEVEKVLKLAVAKAFSEKRKVNTEDFIELARETKPISVVRKASIDALRTKALTHYRLASSPPATANEVESFSSEDGGDSRAPSKAAKILF